MNVRELTQPSRPTRRRRIERTRDLALFLLMPGLTNSLQRRLLGISEPTHTRLLRWAQQQADADPNLALDVTSKVEALTVNDGLRLAQGRRRGGHLSFWSRLAICELVHNGMSRSGAAAQFRCSRRTIDYVLRGAGRAFEPMSGKRLLTPAQASPPGKWAAARPGRPD